MKWRSTKNRHGHLQTKNMALNALSYKLLIKTAEWPALLIMTVIITLLLVPTHIGKTAGTSAILLGLNWDNDRQSIIMLALDLNQGN